MGNSQASQKTSSPAPSPPIPKPQPQPVLSPKPQPVLSPKPQPVLSPKPQPVLSPKPQPVLLPKPQPRVQSSSGSHSKPAISWPASQTVKHSVNNYVIPAADSKDWKDRWDITPCSEDHLRKQLLRVCPQYNGQGCVAPQCRRLHVCLYWLTKTCNRNSCKYDHNVNSMHNKRLLEARGLMLKFGTEKSLEKSLGRSYIEEEQQICMFSVLRKCTQNPCKKVHSTKNYLWEVNDGTGWIQFSYNQSDYLESMYSHPSEECVVLVPLQAHVARNKNLQKLACLFSKETSWTVDFESFKLKGASREYEVRRLSTVSDLTSRVPVATRWLWYWQDDAGCWEPYTEGSCDRFYYLALSDHLEYMLRAKTCRRIVINIGYSSYIIDGRRMTQERSGTGKVRRVRRRPACSLVQWKSVKFDELFWAQPAMNKFLKLPILPLSSEFAFVENLLKQTLTGLQIASIYRIQNDHLWKVYQNKKRLLTSLYNGEVTATNEQYLFHGTSHQAVDHICRDNLDWKLWGTNVGHAYGQGIYFTNMAKVAHSYAKRDKSGKQVMLVVLVLVGKMTRGHRNMNFPPMNHSTGRNYDTTCNDDLDASIFVKYDRDEYYPAYVVRYKAPLHDLD